MTPLTTSMRRRRASANHDNGVRPYSHSKPVAEPKQSDALRGIGGVCIAR
jgi:hypothetical protein